MSSKSCYHCHLPIHGPVLYTAAINDQEQPMCCPGCQAVATAIVSGGLESYYKYRTEAAQQADLDQVLQTQILEKEYELYDRDDLQQNFTRTVSDNRKEARLLIEGITCSACIWLLEHHLSAIGGVDSVTTVNLSQHTATLVYDPEQVKISTLMLAVLSVGYKAHPWRQEQQEALLEKENKQFIRRLAVAGIGFMQVMMYAIALYAGADEDFRDLMRWTSALLATPVVLYSAPAIFCSRLAGFEKPSPGHGCSRLDCYWWRLPRLAMGNHSGYRGSVF